MLTFATSNASITSARTTTILVQVGVVRGDPEVAIHSSLIAVEFDAFLVRVVVVVRLYSGSDWFITILDQ